MDESLKKKAYLEGLKLKDTELDQEAIYARLEKQGIPRELAVEVAYNVVAERQKDMATQWKTYYRLSLIAIGIGILGAIALAFLYL